MQLILITSQDFSQSLRGNIISIMFIKIHTHSDSGGIPWLVEKRLRWTDVFPMDGFPCLSE